MRWFHPLEVGLVIGAAAISGALVLVSPAGLPEWLFGTVMLSALFYVVRLDGDALLGARSERRRMHRLLSTDPHEMARAAVEQERGRLASDIAGNLKETLHAVQKEVQRLDLDTGVDPTPALHRIQQQTREATSELRRQLGLLRQQNGAEAQQESDPSSPPPSHPSLADLALAVPMVVLAALEALTYPSFSSIQDWSAWSVVLTALAAGTVVGRSSAVALSTAVCASLFAIAALLHIPIVTGLWVVGTIGVLLWTCSCSWTLLLSRTSAAVLLVTCVIANVGATDPENLPITLVVMALAVTGGTLVGAGRRRSEAASRQAGEREQELRSAADSAVHAERAQVARDLHDLVSHAVGLIAMQSAAAEVSWPHDPEAVGRAVEIIRTTAERTLAEVELLPGGTRTRRRTLEDVRGLVDRMRAAGAHVDLTIVSRPDPRTTTVVYRIIQEALTNAVRHAPGASVQVEIDCRATGSVVLVSDDGPGPTVGSTRGYGLVGLAERVGFAGGTLECGPRRDGQGFCVSARLPASERLALP
jgi:signal transduction histidine kinase